MLLRTAELTDSIGDFKTFTKKDADLRKRCLAGGEKLRPWGSGP